MRAVIVLNFNEDKNPVPLKFKIIIISVIIKLNK